MARKILSKLFITTLTERRTTLSHLHRRIVVLFVVIVFFFLFPVAVGVGILKLIEDGRSSHGIHGLRNLAGAQKIFEMFHFLQGFGVGDGKLNRLHVLFGL